MPKKFVNGVNLYYEQVGNGPDLVFISGIACDRGIWNVNLFKDRFRVLTFDNRGVGQSDVPDKPYMMQAFADDTVALCKSLGIKKAHFVGHSMGGHIVQAIAAHHPDLVEKVVIACSEALLSPVSYWSIKLQIDLRKQNVSKRTLLENYMPVLFSLKFLENRDLIAQLIEMTLNNPYPQLDKGYIGQAEAIMAHDTRHLLSKIKCPTLVLGCEKDLLTPIENSEYLHKHISNSTLKVIQNCGHAPFIEVPDQFFKILMEYFLVKSAP